MSKLELQAIRDLPDEYIRDGTEVITFNESPVVLNPKLVPMIYSIGSGTWRPLTLDGVGAHRIR